PAIGEEHRGIGGLAEAPGGGQERAEYRLRDGVEPANEGKDFARCRPLFLRRDQLAAPCRERPQRLRLVPKSLRQALLQVADPGVVPGRLTGNRELGFLGLRWLWTPAHRSPLASYDSAGDRLGEPVNQGKGTRQPELVTAEGLCAGRVNLSIIRGCVWRFSYPTHLVERQKER